MPADFNIEALAVLKEIVLQLKIANRLEALRMKDRYPSDGAIDDIMDNTEI